MSRLDFEYGYAIAQLGDALHEAERERDEALARVTELEAVAMGHSGRCPYTKASCERRREAVAALTAENAALRDALEKLSNAFHPGCRAEFELQPVQYYSDVIANALKGVGLE